MICSSLGCCSLLEQLWEALGVLPSSVLDHVLELVVPPLVGAFAVRTGRLLPSSALALARVEFPSGLYDFEEPTHSFGTFFPFLLLDLGLLGGTFWIL